MNHNPKKNKDDIVFLTAMIEGPHLTDEAHENDTASLMADYRIKTFALEEDEHGAQNRTLAATANVFISRRWIHNFPDNPSGCPLWDDADNNNLIWQAIRKRVIEWNKMDDDGHYPEMECCGEDLLIFDMVEVSREYRRLGAASSLCRFVRTTMVSPQAGALIVALVNKENQEALAFWGAFGLAHQIGECDEDGCVVMAGLWGAAFRRWAPTLGPEE